MGELSDIPQNPIGLSVTQLTSTGDKVLYSVKGETHPHRNLLRELGGRWDGIERAWIFDGIDPRPALRDHLEHERGARGLSDSVVQVELHNRPHYWGHRQRLRDRFLAGDDNGLPDYELLELLLFFSIPKIDTKPLAKQLLGRFGSLAGVVNIHRATRRVRADGSLHNHLVQGFTYLFGATGSRGSDRAAGARQLGQAGGLSARCNGAPAD
jgi:hypothetical protein